MKGDFSRSSFDSRKHYTGVRMQQGRVQLDADWNEQADILLHLIGTPLEDVLGPGATGVTEPGFAITLVEPAQKVADPGQAEMPEEPMEPVKTLPDFQIGAGRYYVEGMLCENESPVRFSMQPDYPDAESRLRQPLPEGVVRFLVYLDVWQRHITAVEDPEIREIALGGPDTTTRVKTVWQVKLLPLPADPADDQNWRDPDNLRVPADKGRLQARRRAAGAALENRLYRVEIHTVADEQVTFKWSRENGSVVFPIMEQRIEAFTWDDVLKSVSEDLIGFLKEGLGLVWVEDATISKSEDGKAIHIKKDEDWVEIVLDEGERTATLTTNDEKRRLLRVAEEHGKRKLYVIAHLRVGDEESIVLNLDGLARDPCQLRENDSVELVDDVTVLSGRSLPLCKVTELDRPNARVTLKAEQGELDQIVAEIGARELHHPLLRRWEGAAGAQDKPWLPLENGIEVAFSERGTYQVGDYWLIPARTRSGDGIEWPRKEGKPLAQAPHGIAHHYAPLGLLEYQEGHWSVLTEESTAFRSLPQITANLSATDGQLAAALSRLREVEGTVHTLVGQTHVFEIVKSEEALEKGDLVSLDRAALERMDADDPWAELPVKRACSEERHGPLVVGVVTEPVDDHRYRVALYGRVCCKVKGSVEPGDLLVPSPESGHAEGRPWFGGMRPIIGKALGSTAFDKGRQTGTLDMLVTLGYRMTGLKAPFQNGVVIGISAVALILMGSFVVGRFLGHPKTFRLDIHYPVVGFVTKSPDKASYNRGDAVTLKAVPDPNGRFNRWSGALSHSINPAPLVMDADKSVTACFETTNSIDMKLVYIPAGEFTMGSPSKEKGHNRNESPQHQVSISGDFWMGQTEVTQGQFMEVMKDPNYVAPWSEDPNVPNDPNGPAVYVTWNDANDFCSKLSELEGRTYRLPTEAEWEYACRAGTATRFSFGDGDPCDYAWFRNNALDMNEPYVHPVGRKNPNPWGLYDMHGNVWEWCSDWYGRDYYSNRPGVDPMGPSSGNAHSLRGGSWDSSDSLLRCSSRYFLNPAGRLSNIGFRVLCSQR